MDEDGLVPGDWLIAGRVGYLHHGIYDGAGHVIALIDGVGVCRQRLDDFAAGFTLRRVRAERLGIARERAHRRARAALGGGRYHLVRNNCEHFARWCATGQDVSLQVAGVAAAMATGLAVAMVVVHKPIIIGTASAIGAWLIIKQLLHEGERLAR
jgi:hypothetical protein